MNPTEDELVVFNRFREILQNILLISNDEIEMTIPKSSANTLHEKYYKRSLQYWTLITKFAKILIEAGEEILFTENWDFTARYIIKTPEIKETLFDTPCSDISALYAYLNLMQHRLSDIVDKLLKTKRFTNSSFSTIQDKQSAKEALDEYIKSGEAIISSPDYANSRLDKLDRLLVNYTKNMMNVIRGEIKNVDMQLVTEYSFVAIAAPSLEGKTQAAFTLRSAKPLFFPLLEDNFDTNLICKQQIYQNFKSHADILKKCAIEDEKKLGAENCGTASLQCSGSKKLWTLGFLKKIVELSKLNYNSEDNWMAYYANMADFKFEKVSIYSIPIGYFSEFCMFLDEYTRNPLAIFVRNLSRALQMMCICANSNTMVDKVMRIARSSGGAGDLLCSVVITSLNSPCEQLLNENLHLAQSIQIIKDVALRDQENGNPVCEFLDHFCSVQLKSLRSGVAVYIAKILKHVADQLLSDNLSINLGSLMDFITSQLSNYLKFRKPSLKNEKSANYGKIALLFPITFSKTEPSLQAKVSKNEYDDNQDEKIVQVKKDTERSSTFCKQGKFLENHLFHLVNPHYPDNWMFLTMPPADNSVMIFPRKAWYEEYTYFKTDEIFTRLASLFIPFDRTIKTILSQANRATYRRSSIGFDWISPVAHQNANSIAYQMDNQIIFEFPANPLDVLTAVSVVDASQHSFSMQTVQHLNLITGASSDITERKYSFAGQNGTVFIQNLIINLIKSGPNSVLYLARSDPLADFDFHSSENFDLKIDFLDQCLVPFLYSIDHDIPILDTFSVPGSGFFTSKYERTADAKQIDGKFKVQFNGRLANVSTECKNWKAPLGSDKLLEILEKALLPGKDSCLSLIFCRNSVSPTDRNSCREYCSNVRINVYRVTKIRSAPLNFSTVPYFGEEMNFSDPRMVCIIFESESINQN